MNMTNTGDALTVETEIQRSTLYFTVRHPNAVTASIAASTLAAVITPITYPNRTVPRADANPCVLGAGRGYATTVSVECDSESEAIAVRAAFFAGRLVERVVATLAILAPPAAAAAWQEQAAAARREIRAERARVRAKRSAK